MTRSTDIVTGTMQTAMRWNYATNAVDKPVPYLKFDHGWQSPTGGGYVGGDVVPVDIDKWDLVSGNIDGRRFSANPAVGVGWTCHVFLLTELTDDGELYDYEDRGSYVPT